MTSSSSSSSSSSRAFTTATLSSLSAQQASAVKPKTAFLWESRVLNTLPAVPSACKRLTIPLPLSRLTQVGLLSTLSARKRYEPLTDRFLSIPIDLADPLFYCRPLSLQKGQFEDERDRDIVTSLVPSLRERNRNAPRTAASRALGKRSGSEVDNHLHLHPLQSQSSKEHRIQHISRDVLMKQGYANWARKPEYTANVNFFKRGSLQEGLVDVRKAQQEEIERRKVRERESNTREAQLERIASTFELIKEPLKHKRKPNMTIVRSLPVLPLFLFDILGDSDAILSLDTDLTQDEDRVENNSGKTNLSHNDKVWVQFNDSLRPVSDNSLPLTVLLEQNGPAKENASTISEGAPILALYSSSAGSTGTENEEKTESSDVKTKQHLQYVRDYELLPVASVDASNSHLLQMTNDTVFYSRFVQRRRLTKRMRLTKQDEQLLMAQRPESLSIATVNELQHASGTEAADDVMSSDI